MKGLYCCHEQESQEITWHSSPFLCTASTALQDETTSRSMLKFPQSSCWRIHFQKHFPLPSTLPIPPGASPPHTEPCFAWLKFPQQRKSCGWYSKRCLGFGLAMGNRVRTLSGLITDNISVLLHFACLVWQRLGSALMQAHWEGTAELVLLRHGQACFSMTAQSKRKLNSSAKSK